MIHHLQVALLKRFDPLVFFLDPCPLLLLLLELSKEELLDSSRLSWNVELHKLALRADIELFLVDLLFLIEAVEFEQPVKDHLLRYLLIFPLIQNDHEKQLMRVFRPDVQVACVELAIHAAKEVLPLLVRGAELHRHAAEAYRA